MYDVFTVSETKKDLRTLTGELLFKAEYTFSDCPAIDILVVPGGTITEELLANTTVINWLQKQSNKAAITLSVCSGAILLAKAGLLTGRSAFFKAGEILEYGDAWKSVQRKLAGLPVHRTITDKCIKCGKCAKLCPFHAVVEGKTQFEIQPERCVGIGPCAKLCPVAAIESSF